MHTGQTVRYYIGGVENNFANVRNAMRIFGVMNYTMYHAMGVYRAGLETSVVIECIGLPDHDIMPLATHLRKYLDQETVLVTKCETHYLLVGDPYSE